MALCPYTYHTALEALSDKINAFVMRDTIIDDMLMPEVK
jgi:hypothetical protein